MFSKYCRIFVDMIEKTLKELIDEQGIRYNFIAEKIGVSPTALNFWLNGVSKIPKKREQQIRELLKK